MRLQEFGSVLYLGIGLMSLLTIAVCLVGVFFPAALSLCFTPVEGKPVVCPSGTGGPFPGDVPLVAFVGLIGGALSAVISIRHLRGTSAPYSIPVALSFLKLPWGALTAVAGLLLLRGGFIPGFSNLDSPEQILAYAVVFGVAQQLATQFVDRRAREVLSTVPSQASVTHPPRDGQHTSRDSLYVHDIGPVWAPSLVDAEGPNRPLIQRITQSLRGQMSDKKAHEESRELGRK
jgi:hypothetical protein